MILFGEVSVSVKLKSGKCKIRLLNYILNLIMLMLAKWQHCRHPLVIPQTIALIGSIVCGDTDLLIKPEKKR